MKRYFSCWTAILDRIQEIDNKMFDMIGNISKDHIITIEQTLQMHLTPNTWTQVMCGK